MSDISEGRVEGLETLDYLDNLQNKERFTEQGDAITFESEFSGILGRRKLKPWPTLQMMNTSICCVLRLQPPLREEPALKTEPEPALETAWRA